MTLAHRLTFARDGPKVMTVTDSTKLPYTFEPGMFIVYAGKPKLIMSISSAGNLVTLSDTGNPLHLGASDVLADIDHPGTRGLLLAQYREASGHEAAGSERVRDSGEWWVLADPFDDPEQRPPVGCGESEGAAILDALTRLAASKAAAVVEAVVDGDCHRRVDALAGRMNMHDARLDRIEAALENLGGRLSMIDGRRVP